MARCIVAVAATKDALGFVLEPLDLRKLAAEHNRVGMLSYRQPEQKRALAATWLAAEKQLVSRALHCSQLATDVWHPQRLGLRVGSLQRFQRLDWHHVQFG